MKVIELIELVQEAANGIQTLDDRSKHEEVIRAVCGRAYNQMIGDYINKGFKNLSLFYKLYKNIGVEFDAGTDTYYSLLPVDISFLPDVKSGVRSISPMQDSNSELIPINREQVSVLFNSDPHGIDDSFGYIVGINEEGDSYVEYYGMTSDSHLDEVKMYIIRPFELYDDEENIHIPIGEDQMLLTICLKILQGQPQKDLKYSSSEIK